MSVVGIVLLISMLLVLQLITQTPVAEARTQEEVSVEELQTQIEAMEQIRRELQDEIATLHQAGRDSAAVLSPDRMNALESVVERIEAETARLEQEIDEARRRKKTLESDPRFHLLTAKEQEVHDLEAALAETEMVGKDLAEEWEKSAKAARNLEQTTAAQQSRLAEDVPNKLFVSPHQATDKTPFLLVYGAEGLTVLSFDGKTPSTRFDSLSSFSRRVSARNRSKDFFVVYVRPSRFGRYEKVVDRLQSLGFDVGLQVIAEDVEISLKP